MNVILWAVVGLAALVFLIAVSVTCTAFAETVEWQIRFAAITGALVRILSLAASATLFAGLLIAMLERGVA